MVDAGHAAVAVAVVNAHLGNQKADEQGREGPGRPTGVSFRVEGQIHAGEEQNQPGQRAPLGDVQITFEPLFVEYNAHRGFLLGWVVVSGQWSVDSEQWTVVSGQWSGCRPLIRIFAHPQIRSSANPLIRPSAHPPIRSFAHSLIRSFAHLVPHGNAVSSQSRGFTGTPPTHNSQCRWGPVTRPVPPMAPSRSPVFTSWPSCTSMRERCQ